MNLKEADIVDIQKKVRYKYKRKKILFPLFDAMKLL
jgi:hypothetical protein